MPEPSQTFGHTGNLTAIWSDISDMSNSSNATSARLSPPLRETVPLLIFLSCVICSTIFGNCFTIYAFIRFDELRTPFNSFIFNLAIADFFVGIIVMPCFAVYTFYGYWPLGEPLCSIWIFTDWFMTFESVVTLAVISVERLWSIRWPIHYQQANSPKTILRVIIVTWMVVFCLWMPGYLKDRVTPGNVVEDCSWDPAKVDNYPAGVCIGLLGYLLPFCFMVVCYVYVGLNMRKRLKNVLPKMVGGMGGATSIGLELHDRPGLSSWIKDHYSHASPQEGASTQRPSHDLSYARKLAAKVVLSREKSVLLTLGAIVIAFTVCWIPFYAFFFVTLFHWDANPPAWFGTLTYWTAYLNSAVNPFIYTALHRDFRRKFLDTLHTVFGTRCRFGVPIKAGVK